ncbi:IS21 family transposase [Fuchsiella alkaliacetigena]|uniref:IS21 family transposase n=1 Tax=Fuchsiella alkaliacetigena TaxID=957042 RepID=UPI00200B71C5|nr:IS21 family transposase [Fuchsiella alkaliacetigena]MCK8825940.1 IS21 family transposase [Fuchsiella alkaliacetigena]
MLAMAQINYIRVASDMEDKSYNQIAKELDIDRRTVKKYAEMENLSQRLTTRERKAPVMDPVKPIIDKILIEDKKNPRKLRHTAKRIYERLVEEHKFKGSYSSVKKYVKVKKEEIYGNNKSALPLKHPGGEAQADFGEVLVRYQGEERKGHYLVLSFPFSNASFVQLFWSENQDCLIEGLINIFESIGGVPNKIWFDNSKAAVTKIHPDGSRSFTESFRRFAAHYRFKPVFCNPGKGNEKGNVENKICYVRRNFFVPIVQFEDLNKFNKELL